MRQFKPEYYILLRPAEIEKLVSASNREEFESIRAFLYATRNLKGLRRLSFPPDSHSWEPPNLYLTEDQTITDDQGEVRGTRHAIPLPARPGEAQMALSHDWFWAEFCRFLRENRVWAWQTENECLMVAPISDPPFAVQEAWARFWEKLSSQTFLDQSLTVFLNHKSLFKKQAKPWDSNDIPILSKDMARYLLNYYQHGPARKRHFKQGSIPKAVADLEQVIENKEYAQIPLEPQDASSHMKGGDFHLGEKQVRCAACAKYIPKKQALKRLAIFLKDSDERPQSGRHKDDRNFFCEQCVATAFLCPVKLAPETLTVRFLPPPDRAYPQRPVEDELKKFVAQSLDVHAGNFISLHISEFVDRKPLARTWGAYHYALWKLAKTFPPELFGQGFGAEVHPGEACFKLPGWALWFVSSLAAWDNGFQYHCYGTPNYRNAFSQFLRLVGQRKVFQAFYMLIKDKDGLVSAYERSWRLYQLQDIWKDFEKLLNKEEPMPIPDYPKIAGFAGLLLPLAERVQSSKKGENEKKRAVGKLLEEADRPIQYAYTAARESGSPDFIFRKQPRNHFFYEKAIELLQWAGEDTETLKAQGREKAKELLEKKEFQWLEGTDELVFIGPAQIARVTSALVKEGSQGQKPPYENEADWRAFAYQVKLALWSMFPRHLGA